MPSTAGDRAHRRKSQWRLSFPLLLLYALTRISSSSAQYIRPRSTDDQPHGWGSREVHASEQIAKRGTQDSTSKELHVNSYGDFCLLAPKDPFGYISGGPEVVSWCAKDGHGTRLIPDGTLHGVTFVKTDNWVQVSGYGDLTKINIAPGDMGGQFDSKDHKPDGSKVMVGGKEVSNWVTLISATTYCMRACTGDAKFCPTTYDHMGCWFLTGNKVGDDGTWQDCSSDDGDPPGVFDGKTYVQEAEPTPDPTSPALRNCNAGSSVANGQSPPPLYNWDGSGVAVPNGQQPTETKDGHQSTSWVAVQTCVPCGGGKTEQVQMTQIQTGNAMAVADAAESGISVSQEVPKVQASKTLSGGGLTSGLANLQDQLAARKRDGETTTSNGQCCYTTWTPSVIGGAGPTKTSSGGSGQATKTSGSGSAGPTTSGKSAAGGVSFSGVLPSTSSGSKPSGSVSASVGNRPIVSGTGGNLTTGNVTGNGTGNGTGNDSSYAGKLYIIGVDGMGKVFAMTVILALSLAGAIGGWSVI